MVPALDDSRLGHPPTMERASLRILSFRLDPYRSEPSFEQTRRIPDRASWS